MIENKTLQRYEFKYFLNEKTSNEIKNHIRKFMILDKFADFLPDKNYFVRSIYFDDNFNSNFSEKVDGYRIRKKFRLRYYNKDQSKGPMYLETKGRNLERTYKRRVKIDKDDFDIIMNDYSLNELLKKYPNNATMQDFVFEYYKKKLKPKVLIDYSREPFVNKHGLYFRLTFDKNLKCKNLNKNLKNIIVGQDLMCKAGYTILEVKFDRSIPLWFHRIIQSYNLTRQSISKFVLGMCYTKLGEESSD